MPKDQPEQKGKPPRKSQTGKAVAQVLHRGLLARRTDADGLPVLLDAVASDRRLHLFFAAGADAATVLPDGGPGCLLPQEVRPLGGSLLVVADRSLSRQTITGVFDLAQPVDALRTLAESQKAMVTEVRPYLLIVSRR